MVSAVSAKVLAIQKEGSSGPGRDPAIAEAGCRPPGVRLGTSIPEGQLSVQHGGCREQGSGFQEFSESVVKHIHY